jgi:hypothetical protein
MLKKLKFYLIMPLAAVLLFASCQKSATMLSEELKAELTDTLEAIAVEFLRSWEPPFHPEKALSLFTQSEDFCLIIDGLPIREYAEWAKGVPNFMSDDDHFFKSYKHDIKDIKTVVLSPDVGVVTIIYVWDSISNDEVHTNTDGAITMTCRREHKGWRIVHYHGSHDTEKIIK